MEIKMKGKAIIGIAMVVAVLASAVGVASAADESVVEFKDQAYTVRISFPDGEGIAHSGSKNMSLRYHASPENVNLITVSGCDVYNTIKILIKIDGGSFNDLSLFRWQESSFGWQRQICLPFYYVFADGTANESWAGPIDPEYSHLTKERVYKIRVHEENSVYCDIYFMLELGEDCNTYCENLCDHGIWDGESEYPNCGCICEKGWEMRVDGCVACEDICKEKGEHYIYDPENSYKNDCECKCEDGYERKYYNDSCEKVECPPNSTNVADLAGSCPKDRKLNRHCCCNESYIRSWGTCVREDSGEEDYYIKPVVHEITVGEKIEFSLVKIKHGRYTTVSNDKVVWVVVNKKSIHPNSTKELDNIGTINGNGVFIAKNIGTCFVCAKIDGEPKSKFKIAVKCCQDEEGDLNEIIRLYKLRIPKGQLWHDLDSLSYSYYTKPPYAPQYPAHFLNNLLNTPLAAGALNNLCVQLGYKAYSPYVCSEYKEKVMKFLYDIQSNPKECSLLKGFEFSQITGGGGMHFAVVIYEQGTSWEETGIVLDPWPAQKPETFSIDQWKFYGRSTYKKSLIDCAGDAAVVLWEGFVGMLTCPVNILITDNEGRRLGVLDDGSMAFEIPNASIMNLPNDAGNNNWYFELDSDVSSNYNLEIIGTDEGTFELLIANKKNKSIKYYGEQPIAQGEKAEIVLDSSNPEASLILQDGSEVQPTSIQPTSIEKSKSDYYNHILVQPAVQKVLIGQNLQFDGFNTTPVTVSRIVSGDIADVYQADANNRIHNVNWPTSGAFYVNYRAGYEYDAQLSVEEPDMPLKLKVGTKEVSSIILKTKLTIDTGGMNLFPEDQVDLVIKGPDGQIKYDDVNHQKFTDITVAELNDWYGDNNLETAGWTIGAYTFKVKTDGVNACGLEAESVVRPLLIVKGEIAIEADTTSTVELETVKLVVTGVADDPIRVEASPLSDNVLFKEGIDDTPTGANYHVNWFTDTIDADGIRRYAVEFNDMGIYTIKVTVTGGDREGDSDTVDITVLEKEVPLDLPAPIPSELELAELFTSKSVYPKGEKVNVHYYITNTCTVDVDEYHVEYDIIDAKGKTVYENVGGAHSISAGDENKWHSEMWEIPSNAEYGPYTVKARLKWSSRTDTETTDFFVTLATKTEDPRAELEIAELYTSKSAYLKGENVKVCYHINNVGTVDVDEYHVMYEIRGVDGEKICWFILSPHRIAVGEKQKWCPTGELAEWKIPSNAEYGTHTVEATLIWGSKTVEKKTAFLVKPN